MTGARRAAAVLLLAALPLGAASCGVPTGGAPETIAPADVPFGLASPSPAASPAATDPTQLDEPRVYLVDAAEVLVPRGREVAGGTVRERLTGLLEALAAGPSTTDLGERLTTALPPTVGLAVEDVSAGTATVALTGNAEAASGRESRRAVAQLVLTATSLAGIDQVLLTRDGVPVAAPLPSGELTAEPLVAADYSVFLSAAPLTAPPT